MSHKKYTWYVESLNTITNGVIYEHLKHKDLGDTCEPAICADGKEHNLWRCAYYFAKALIGEKESNNSLSFNIFVQ